MTRLMPLHSLSSLVRLAGSALLIGNLGGEACWDIEDQVLDTIHSQRIVGLFYLFHCTDTYLVHHSPRSVVVTKSRRQ